MVFAGNVLTDNSQPETDEVSTGWVSNDGQWVYYDESGELHKGWLEYNGDWYYLDEENGVMQTGFVTVNFCKKFCLWIIPKEHLSFRQMPHLKNIPFHFLIGQTKKPVPGIEPPYAVVLCFRVFIHGQENFGIMVTDSL